ncbi:MAG: hypothetical protein ACLFPL_01610 [Candidatus Nanoarchaeia archaeon]
MRKIITSLILLVCIIALVGFATTLPIIEQKEENQKIEISNNENNLIILESSQEVESTHEDQEVRGLRKTSSGYVDIQDQSTRYTNDEVQQISNDRGIFVSSREEVRIY